MSRDGVEREGPGRPPLEVASSRRRTAGRDAATGVEGGGDRIVGSGCCGGYALLDPLSQRLGRVERMFCNRSGEPQYVRIRAGLFGNRLALIPVLGIAVDHENRTVTLR